MLNNIAEESEDRWRGIIEHALDIVTLLDGEGTVVYNSPAFARQLGYESWEVLGRSFFEFLHEEDRNYIEREFKKLAGNIGAAGTALEFRFLHKDGRWRAFEAIVSNLLKNEAVQAMVLNSRDVTEQKASEAELEKYRTHLEELVDQRTRELITALKKEKMVVEQQKIFVSMVSHEFRTPLTIIDGNAQIIQKRGATLAPEVIERRMEAIRTGVDRLARLIETILSSNMLETGNLTPTLAPCDLIGIIRNVCVERLDIMPNHKISIDVQKGLPKMMIDEKLIHQVMVNLVTNAVKYSPQNPRIEVKACQEGEGVVIQVTDHGVGIPENELPKIFTRYYRASTSGGIPGSGLGLSLVKQFVDLHGGRIEMQSEVGVGTTAVVWLPIHAGKNQKGEPDGKNIAD